MAGNFPQLEGECKKSVEHFRKELGRLRTGRASSALLDGIHADYYGSSTPLNQLGMINVPEPRLITIQIYDGSAVDAVEKAIQAAGLGLNPMRDGNLLRINIPPLTEERRKDLVKKLHQLAEEEKVAMRNHRREANDGIKKLEKDKKLSQDESRKQQEEVQKITDKYIAEIEQITKVKEKEIMDV